METNIIHPNLVDVIRVEAAANMRQVATVAGTLVALDGRTPFGTSFLGLDARLTVQPGDEKISLGDLLPQRAEWLKGRLITQVDIPINVALTYEYVARTPADWPLVCVAVVRWPGGRTRVALGGFGRAPILAFDGPETGGVEAAVKDAYSHAGDQWASAAYRQEMVATLTARALSKINESQV
jgi:CO/xanthine dehydrogenase FAD-binding subunit